MAVITSDFDLLRLCRIRLIGSCLSCMQFCCRNCPSFPITIPKPLWMHLTPVDIESCANPGRRDEFVQSALRTQTVISRLTQCVDPRQVGQQRMSCQVLVQSGRGYASGKRGYGALSGSPQAVATWAGLRFGRCGFRCRHSVIKVEELLDPRNLHRAAYAVGDPDQRQMPAVFLVGHVRSHQRPDAG